MWRIDEAVEFRRSFPGGMQDARERIDRTVRDDVREVIGRHTLTEVLKDARAEIMREITRQTLEALEDKGIAVIDVRINRTELPEGTEESVYARPSIRPPKSKSNAPPGETFLTCKTDGSNVTSTYADANPDSTRARPTQTSR